MKIVETQKLNNRQILNKERFTKKLNFEAKQNLLGFFGKLLEIDMRNNPEKYKKPKEKND